MIYIVLSIIGIVALWLVRLEWSKKGQITFILTVLIGGLVLFLCADFFFLQPQDVTQRGLSSFLTQLPWFEIGLYFVMLAGITAKYFFDAIGKGNKIEFQKWQLLKPMLVSPIVFGVVYGSIGESTPLLLNSIFAFQNGFFWQTVLNR